MTAPAKDAGRFGVDSLDALIDLSGYAARDSSAGDSRDRHAHETERSAQFEQLAGSLVDEPGEFSGTGIRANPVRVTVKSRPTNKSAGCPGGEVTRLVDKPGPTERRAGLSGGHRTPFGNSGRSQPRNTSRGAGRGGR